MKTKEAIEKVERISYIFEADEIFKKNGIQLVEVINLLKRSEKFEAMWGEIMESSYSYDDWESLDLDELKQKYFPKVKEKDRFPRKRE